jgi:hypothetical protein
MRSDLHESLKTSSQLVPDSLQVSRKVRVPADKEMLKLMERTKKTELTVQNIDIFGT